MKGVDEVMHRTSSKVLLGVAAFVLFLVPVAAIAGGQTFTDVPPTDWAFEDVEWLAAEGLTNGCGDGTTFCPDDNLSRREMAAFTHRLALTIAPRVFTQTGRIVTGALDNCEIGPYTAPVRQIATFNGGAFFRTDAAGEYGMAKVTSNIDAGGWANVPGQFYLPDEGSTSGQFLSTPLSGAMILEAGHEYRFGVSEGGSGDWPEADCELVITVHHAPSGILIGSSLPAASVSSGDVNG